MIAEVIPALDGNMFFSLLGKRLTELGLSERKAHEEISALRYRFKNDGRFGALIRNAGEKEVNLLAERIYAKTIVRSNAPAINEFKRYNGIMEDISPEGAKVRESGSSEIVYDEKPDYISYICNKLKKMFDSSPASKLLLIIIVPLVILLLAAAFVLFAAVFLALALIVIGFFILACAVALGGTVIVLTGLIYGSVKVFTGSPEIGWYEIGIGLIALGLTVFAVVVFYNYSVRITPAIIRQLGSLLRLFMLKLSSDFKTAKGVFLRR